MGEIHDGTRYVRWQTRLEPLRKLVLTRQDLDVAQKFVDLKKADY